MIAGSSCRPQLWLFSPNTPTLSLRDSEAWPQLSKLNSAIHPADKYLGNQLRYPLDRDLSIGLHYPSFEQPGQG